MPEAKEWSPEEDREIVFGKGSLSEIAVRINRTPQAVYSRLYVIRAALKQSGRRKAVEVLGKAARSRKYYGSCCPNPKNHRRAWAHEEELMILDPDRPSDHLLAERIGRTVRAIHDRRTLIRSREEG